MENWCNNTNLQEKGEKNQPTNYRGITLTSCLEKLFTSLLGNRLVTFLETQNIINTHQVSAPIQEQLIAFLFYSN